MGSIEHQGFVPCVLQQLTLLILTDTRGFLKSMAVVSILQIGRNKSPSYYFCHLPKAFRESYAGKSPLSAVYLRFHGRLKCGTIYLVTI